MPQLLGHDTMQFGRKLKAASNFRKNGKDTEKIGSGSGLYTEPRDLSPLERLFCEIKCRNKESG